MSLKENDVKALRKILSVTAEEEFELSEKRLLSGKEIEERVKKLKCRERKEGRSSLQCEKDTENSHAYKSKVTSSKDTVYGQTREGNSGRHRTIHFSGAHIFSAHQHKDHIKSSEATATAIAPTVPTKQPCASAVSYKTSKRRTAFERLCPAWPTDAH